MFHDKRISKRERASKRERERGSYILIKMCWAKPFSSSWPLKECPLFWPNLCGHVTFSRNKYSSCKDLFRRTSRKPWRETHYRRYQVESTESVKKKKNKHQEQSFSNWICTFPPKLRSECEKYSVLLKKELVFSLNKN